MLKQHLYKLVSLALPLLLVAGVAIHTIVLPPGTVL